MLVLAAAQVTTVHFIRHARAGAEPRGGLSPEGRAQAERVARALAGAGLSALYSSPLPRAAETARIVSQRLQLPVRCSELLRERADFGELPGQSREEFDAMWQRCSRERDFVPASGDSSSAAGRRLERFVSDLAPGICVAALTHGGALADFLRNVFAPEVLRAASPAFAADPYSGVVVRECSITTVRVGDALELLRVAAAEHLDP